MPGDICSHPNKRLETHLINTYEIADELKQRFGIDIIGEDSLRLIVLHDIAKAHRHFQDRLRGGSKKFKHAEPSALLALSHFHDLLGTEAIRHHHGYLASVKDFRKFWGEFDLKGGTAKTINQLPWWEEARALVPFLGEISSSWPELLPDASGWDDLMDLVDDYSPSEMDWLWLRSFYSLLVAADRYDAAVGGQMTLEDLPGNPGAVDQYVEDLKHDPKKRGAGAVDAWREQVRQSVVAHARQIIQQPGVYTLSLPTGAGKTVIGLQVAWEAAQRLDATGIVYVLPFISLVEQNASVAVKIFGAGVQEDHHLAYVDHDNQGALTEDEDPQRRFIEFFRYWQEPIVATTLAKLWEVLYSPQANDSMSFHRLSRAVVVLDEPQTVPSGYWDGLGRTLHLLAEKLGTTFILMTATQPAIAQIPAPAPELAPGQFFFPVVRHRYHWIADKLTIAGVADRLKANGIHERSTLVVMNTKISALRMWRELKQRGLNPYFLSAWMTPRDRERTLQKIKQDEEDGRQRCLVATQVIEAGVDLDFELVFRDLGPLDSIIQVAGRCNRHGDSDFGLVLLAEVIGENGSYCSQVYRDKKGTGQKGHIQLALTKELLKEHPQFDERGCPDLIATYYDRLIEAIQGEQIWENICRGFWGDYLPLIAEEAGKEAMLLVADEESVFADLAAVQKEITPDEDKFVALRLRRQAYQRLVYRAISVSQKFLDGEGVGWYHRLGSMIPGERTALDDTIVPHMWVISGEGIGRVYRPELGFVPAELAEEWEYE